MVNIKLLRKRYIPDEINDLSKDEIFYFSKEVIATKWETIHPRLDFAWGISYYFLNEGYKISQFFTKENKMLYWYCDIIEYSYDEEQNTLMIIDLLVDVIVQKDKTVKIVDLDELGDALEQKLITEKQGVDALRKLQNLLNKIDKNEFPPNFIKEHPYFSPLK